MQHGPDSHQQFLQTLLSSFVSVREQRCGSVSGNLALDRVRLAGAGPGNPAAEAAAILISVRTDLHLLVKIHPGI